MLICCLSKTDDGAPLKLDKKLEKKIEKMAKFYDFRPDFGHFLIILGCYLPGGRVPSFPWGLKIEKMAKFMKFRVFAIFAIFSM